MKLSKAVCISAALVFAALVFNYWIFVFQGQQKALEFLTGYVIELSLSVDNLFLFFLIFAYFKVDPSSQGRILTWGLIGAGVMRALFILAGVALLNHLSWVIYAFGVLLVMTGYKLFFKSDKPIKPEQNGLVRSLKRFFPGNISSFLIVLILVEAVDLLFAIDSIPAVLAVTKDPFIVYTSNIFAILGLRSMYFILVPVIDMFRYLHYTLGIILVFTGIKMMLDPVWHVPIGFALGFIVLVLSISAVISINFRKGGL